MQIRPSFMAAAAALGVATSVSAGVYTNWPIGVEREVDEGVYMKVIEVSQGWRIWRIETRNDVDCRAIKSAIGRSHPIPLGAGAVFGMGTPFLQIYKGYKTPHTFAWETRHWGKVKIQYRRPGEKFWTQAEPLVDDLTQFDGQKLEISLTSWEYPDILVGFAKETGVIDLSGMAAAIEAIDKCNAKGKAG